MVNVRADAAAVNITRKASYREQFKVLWLQVWVLRVQNSGFKVEDLNCTSGSRFRIRAV